MNEFLLEVFLKISTISAASGLVLQGDNLYIVSDNSNYLYTYALSKEELSKHLLYDNNGENEHVQKANKTDLESIFVHNDTLYLFGSGSKPNRNHLFRLAKEQRATIEHIQLDTQANRLQQALNIGPKDYNIEGSFIYGGDYYLFNRGNGPSEQNGIIIVDTAFSKQARFVPVPLSYDGEGTPGFTDAIRVDDKIYFLAAIEHANSTYHDGQIGGSFLGILDLASLTLEKIQKIADTNKFEGITVFADSPHSIEFLLCEDPDNENAESIIYKLTITK